MSGLHLLLVDGLNLVRRVYAAQPGDDGPERAASALESGSHSLRRALRECRPTHAVCVMEGREKSWRHHLWPGYKAGHAPMPAALQEALPAIEEEFARQGVPSFRRHKVEADDVIATMSVKVAGSGGTATILSTDRAFLQLLRPGIRVRDHFRGRDLGAAEVHRKFGVEPGLLVDCLALMGDTTAGIPGVPGVGPKTAARLLDEHGSLEAVLEAADGVAGKLGARLVDHADDARLSLSLVTLQVDLELGVNLQDLRLAPPHGAG